MADLEAMGAYRETSYDLMLEPIIINIMNDDSGYPCSKAHVAKLFSTCQSLI
jgi:hypothetical protein